jgi:glycosyltransferase involved in cell wall biosynthesis
MHIALLVKEFPPDVIGGTETQTMRMATELQQRTDTEVTVFTKSYPGSSNNDSHPYEIVRVPNWQLSPFVSTLTFVLAATLLLIRDADEFDVLQCMMIYPNGFVGQIVNRVRGLPYFAWIRGGDYYFMKDTPGKRWMIKRVLADTRVLVQTEQIANDVYSEFPEATLTVLGNGIEIPEETATGDEIVFVGRLKEQKGVHLLLQAAAELDETVRIVGDGPERTRLEDLAERLDVDANFVGEIPPEEVTRHLCHGKIFVLPSICGEGLPNAVLEAMAVGLPVVVTDTGGVADAVAIDHTGFVVEPGDLDALTQRLVYLCENDEQRNSMGSQARQWVRDTYGWDRICEELKLLYKSLVD